MALLFPTTAVPKAYDITADGLRKMGVEGLILDIDNTLTTHDHPVPDSRILQWLDQMRAADIRLILLSNNHPPRVAPFAQKLGLAFEADAKKPLPGGYRRAASAMSLSPRQTAVVGDQIFTDVLGANLAGMPSILVEPFQMEPFFRFRLKRFLEKGILRRYWKKQRRREL
ncbi:MAG TPA: YqeG family HAD IIIA-type phosphatase [Ruminococcaceae bacterium]|nr:YqeG family HAD IIIA-type phosphatase [Oscillospiraceae bacterium]